MFKVVVSATNEAKPPFNRFLDPYGFRVGFGLVLESTHFPFTLGFEVFESKGSILVLVVLTLRFLL